MQIFVIVFLLSVFHLHCADDTNSKGAMAAAAAKSAKAEPTTAVLNSFSSRMNGSSSDKVKIEAENKKYINFKVDMQSFNEQTEKDKYYCQRSVRIPLITYKGGKMRVPSVLSFRQRCFQELFSKPDEVLNKESVAFVAPFQGSCKEISFNNDIFSKHLTTFALVKALPMETTMYGAGFGLAAVLLRKPVKALFPSDTAEDRDMLLFALERAAKEEADNVLPATSTQAVLPSSSSQGSSSADEPDEEVVL